MTLSRLLFQAIAPTQSAAAEAELEAAQTRLAVVMTCYMSSQDAHDYAAEAALCVDLEVAYAAAASGRPFFLPQRKPERRPSWSEVQALRCDRAVANHDQRRARASALSRTSRWALNAVDDLLQQIGDDAIDPQAVLDHADAFNLSLSDALRAQRGLVP